MLLAIDEKKKHPANKVPRDYANWSYTYGIYLGILFQMTFIPERN